MKMRTILSLWLILMLANCVMAAPAATTAPADRTAVRSALNDQSISISNGLVRIEISRSTGQLTALEDATQADAQPVGLPGGSLYWDANADVLQPAGNEAPPKKGYFRAGPGRRAAADSANNDFAKLMVDTPDRAEVAVSFKHSTFFQFDGEFHYAVLRGVSGVYAYVHLNHPADLPGARLYQTRFVARTVTDDTFDYWSVGPEEFVKIPRAAPVAKLMDATYRLADGTVKTKYLNSVYWAKAPVYGVLGHSRAGSALGVWMIEASPEYHNGGPVKQGQTVHDNVLLRVLQSVHFGASPVLLSKGEAWEKVYGPFLLYVNHADDAKSLWEDASARQKSEAAAWPYPWVSDPAYIKDRGTVSGRLNLLAKGKSAAGAWVILAGPPSEGAWSAQSKGYQFWTRADEDGRFSIAKVIPGTYTLYASGADQPEDFTHDGVKVTAGQRTELAELDWTPVTHGRTLWQIGTFDRSAGEFRNGDNARQYQLFAEYPKQFPNDVTFTIGKSDIRKDWNYAQWSWYAKDPKWRIHFDVQGPAAGKATLTIGFASAQPAHGKLTDLRVAVNGTEIAAIHLPKTGTAGYRGGVQDSPYHVSDLAFDTKLLHEGTNEITLAHADAEPFHAIANADEGEGDEAPPPGTGYPGQVMYDALRLQVQP